MPAPENSKGTTVVQRWSGAMSQRLALLRDLRSTAVQKIGQLSELLDGWRDEHKRVTAEIADLEKEMGV